MRGERDWRDLFDLLDELREGREPARVCSKLSGAETVPGYGCSVNGRFCTPDCEASAAAAQAGRPRA